MKKSLVLVAAAVAFMWSVQADAQLGGLKKAIPGGEKSEPASSVSQESIVQEYIHANVLTLKAQAELSEAFGLKEGAASARAEAEALQSGSTEVDKESMEGTRAVTDAVMAGVQEKMDEDAELSAEGREHYVNGLNLAVESVLATRAMTEDARTFGASAQAEIKSASMMQKAKVTNKLAAGMYVSKELPGFASRLTDNLGKLVSFAASADIPMPDDATDLLASM